MNDKYNQRYKKSINSITDLFNNIYKVLKKNNFVF